MRAGARLAAYGAALVAVLGAGAVVGAAAGPIDVGGGAAEHDNDTGMIGAPPATELPAAGLLVSEDGYSFVPDDRLADAGAFSFAIVGPDGEPVTAYDDLHERDLHLIVVSRDLRHYVHVHPDRDTAGHWTAQLEAFAPGAYRAFADFQPAGGDRYTLGVDLVAPGLVGPMEPLQQRLTDEVGGYEVTLDPADGEVTITVRRGSEVVTTEPYLGAPGHLVALRDGDLAYLHVHPVDEQPTGPVRFAIDVPSTGTYALFFDFQVDGVVNTARFVVDVARPTDVDHAATEH